MRLEPSDVEALMLFFVQAGRSRENAEAWVHAMIDLQESYEKIFNQLLPRAIAPGDSAQDRRELLWDIREELRHIEYHAQDVEGR